MILKAILKNLVPMSILLSATAGWSKSAFEHALDITQTVEQGRQVVCELENDSSVQRVCGALGAYVGLSQLTFVGSAKGATDDMKRARKELNLGARVLMSFCGLSLSKYLTSSMLSRGAKEHAIPVDDRVALKTRMDWLLGRGEDLLRRLQTDAQYKTPRSPNADCSYDRPS